MNTVQIKKTLISIRADYIGMGRKNSTQDCIIIDTIMRLYYETDWLDAEECIFLFKNYVRKGVLDFPEAKRMAMQRRLRSCMNVIR